MSVPSPSPAPRPAQPSAADISDAPLTPALAFQCRACRAIVGDSSLVDCSVRSLGVVALTGVCGVAVGSAPRAATLPPPSDGGPGGGEVAGCVSLACAGCGASLGTRYGADLPPRLARLASLFCLRVDALASHALGAADLLARPGEAANKRAAAAAPSAAATDVALLAARLAELEDELVKVQGVVLVHHERLAGLEAGG